MSEHSVLWSPDELCWAHVILPRCTQTIQIIILMFLYLGLSNATIHTAAAHLTRVPLYLIYIYFSVWHYLAPSIPPVATKFSNYCHIRCTTNSREIKIVRFGLKTITTGDGCHRPITGGLKTSFYTTQRTHRTQRKALAYFLTQTMQEKYASKYATDAADATANWQRWKRWM